MTDVVEVVIGGGTTINVTVENPSTPRIVEVNAAQDVSNRALKTAGNVSAYASAWRTAIAAPGLDGSGVSGANADAFRDDALKALSRAGISAAKDTADFATLDADDDVLAIFLQNAQYNRGSTVPSKPVWGPGSLRLNDIVIDELQPVVDAARANIWFRPTRYYTQVSGAPLTALDLANNDFDNIYIAPGAARSRIGHAKRDTVIGSGCFTLMEDSERAACFGQANFGRAKYVDRGNAFGTAIALTLGQDLRTDPAGRYYEHSVFQNAENPLFVSPTDHTIRAEWDKSGMRTHRPDVLDGSGNLIGGVTYDLKRAYEANLWATSKDDVSVFSAGGRDAAGQMLKGNNTAIWGYRGGVVGLFVNNRAILGDFALENGLFVSDCVVEGTYAAQFHQGTYDTYSLGAVVRGTYAARNWITGGKSLIDGYKAGYSYDQDNNVGVPWNGSGNVLQGPDAGRRPNGVIPDMTDRWYVQNSYQRNPLMTGEFETKFVGINVPMPSTGAASLLGRLHVYAGASGAALTSSGNSLFVGENNTDSFIRYINPNTSAVWTYYGDPDNLAAGGYGYDHAYDWFAVRAGLAIRTYVSAVGDFHVGRVPNNGAAEGIGTARGAVSRASGVFDSYQSGTGNVSHLRCYNGATDASGAATLIGQIASNAGIMSLRDGSGNQIVRWGTNTIGLFGATAVAKSTGWGSATGTATKTTFDTSTVTTAQLAERVKALLDYLTLRGDIGA